MHSYAIALNLMIESMIKRECDNRADIAKVCANVALTLGDGTTTGFDSCHPTKTHYFTGPDPYSDDTLLVGTEVPLWKGSTPFFEQLIPSPTYRAHPDIVRR
jgi:hypothetical protein